MKLRTGLVVVIVGIAAGAVAFWKMHRTETSPGMSMARCVRRGCSVGLQKYVDCGGTLWIEAWGGSRDFAASAQYLIAQMAPASPLEILPADHPLYISENPRGFALNAPEVRRFSRMQRANGEGPKPPFAAATIHQRPAILLSELDLTSGLLGTGTWGIDGYTPETSTQLLTNLLLWTHAQHAPQNAVASP